MTTRRAGPFDRVRVRTCAETEAAGVAGWVGQVYGVTTPSATGVAVVGSTAEDCALNVFFEATGEALWLSPDLLEFIDHAPGTEVHLPGAREKWVRDATGEWHPAPVYPRRSVRERILGWLRGGGSRG